MLMRSERQEALIVAHRVLLSYLVKLVHETLPEDAQAAAMDQAQSLLHNTIEQIFAGVPTVTSQQLQAIASQEIDRIITAPIRRLPAAGSLPARVDGGR